MDTQSWMSKHKGSFPALPPSSWLSTYYFNWASKNKGLDRNILCTLHSSAIFFAPLHFMLRSFFEPSLKLFWRVLTLKEYSDLASKGALILWIRYQRVSFLLEQGSLSNLSTNKWNKTRPPSEGAKNIAKTNPTKSQQRHRPRLIASLTPPDKGYIVPDITFSFWAVLVLDQGKLWDISFQAEELDKWMRNLNRSSTRLIDKDIWTSP